MSEATVREFNAPEAGASASGTTQRAMRHVRARVVDVTKAANGLTDSTAEPGQSETLPEDPWTALAHQGKIIEPPFDVLTLTMMTENNTELNQCIDALETNIDGYGYRFISRLRKDDTDEGDQSANDPLAQQAKVEQAMLNNFFAYATEESFTAFRRKLRRDYESTGNAYFEVIRNAAQEIQGFTHIPSYQMRLGKMDEDALLTTRRILELQPDGAVKLKDQKVWRRFRKFIQSRTISRGTHRSISSTYKVRWYKQFGDDRRMDKLTGEFSVDGAPIPDDRLATEVIHLRIYSPRTPYGIPRYIGNLLAMFGDRAAEEVNYITFRNNNIPSMVVLVSNGQLTDGTIKRLESFVESQIQGSDNYSKFLIVEGEPIADEGEDGGQVKVEIKPLTEVQHKDALFQKYSANNQDKVRRAFRLPPIFVGRSDDYTRSTAEASRRLADEQIFAPERDEFDNLINLFLFPEMGVLYHKFKTNSPNTTDNAQLVKILAGAEKTGGMTPRIARDVLEGILGKDLPSFPSGFNPDTPFSLTMAEAVKSQTDVTEPGQTVTALKALGILGDEDVAALEGDEELEKSAAHLLALDRAVKGILDRYDSDGE